MTSSRVRSRALSRSAIGVAAAGVLALQLCTPTTAGAVTPSSLSKGAVTSTVGLQTVDLHTDDCAPHAAS